MSNDFEKVPEEVYELLHRIVGINPALESVKFLTEPDLFIKDIKFDEKGCHHITFDRPEWLGPEPDIEKLSQVPGKLANAYALAEAEGFLEVIWLPGRDAAIFLSAKGRSTLARYRMGGSVEGLPENGSKVEKEDVPAELREGGKPDGQILSSPYLARESEWSLTKVQISKFYNQGKLTYRLKVGRSFAYLYTELAALRRNLTEEESRKEEEDERERFQ